MGVSMHVQTSGACTRICLALASNSLLRLYCNMNRLLSGLQLVPDVPVPWPTIFAFPCLTQLASDTSMDSCLPVSACTLTPLLPYVSAFRCLSCELTLTYILMLPLPNVPVPCCLAVHDILACVLALLLSTYQESLCTGLWSLSGDPWSSRSFNQQLPLPATLAFVILCVLSPLPGVFETRCRRSPLFSSIFTRCITSW